MMMRRYKAMESMQYHEAQINYRLGSLQSIPIGDESTNWDDKKTVLDFIKQGGHFPQLAIFNASDRLKDDFEVVSKAVKKDAWSIAFASERLKANKEIVELAVHKEPSTLQFVDHNWSDDKELVMAAVKKNGIALKWASSRLQDDDDIVGKATDTAPESIAWASDRFRKDFSYIFYLALSNPAIIEHAHDELRGNKESILTIMRVCCKEEWEQELVGKFSSIEIKELCKGQNPIKALESAIAHETLEATLAKKQEPRQGLKRGLKI